LVKPVTLAAVCLKPGGLNNLPPNSHSQVYTLISWLLLNLKKSSRDRIEVRVRMVE
jgi:hypothetical protein